MEHEKGYLLRNVINFHATNEFFELKIRKIAKIYTFEDKGDGRSIEKSKEAQQNNFNLKL